MEVKPGYKQTEIGCLPNDWQVRRVGDLGRVVRGSSPRPAGDPKFFNGSYIPWLTVAALTTISENQTTVESTESQLTELGASHSRTLEPGTLIIANSGATLGVAKLLGFRCCANDGIAALVQQRCGHLPFIAYFINSQTQRLRQVVATGNGQPNLNTTLISDILVPFPAESEQRAIAQALSDIDDSIQSLERLIAKKRGLKQAAMQQLLTGQTRLAGHGGQGLTKASVEPCPSGWRPVRIKELGKWFSGSTPAMKNPRYWQGQTPWVSPKDMKRLRLFDAQDHISVEAVADGCRVLPAGAILMVIRGMILAHSFPVAKAERPLACNQDIKAVVVNEDVHSDFVLYWLALRSRHLLSLATESTHGTKRLPPEMLFKECIFLPPLPEQKAIAEVISDMDAEIDALEARLAKTRDLKQGMMQELLTGRTRLV